MSDENKIENKTSEEIPHCNHKKMWPEQMMHYMNSNKWMLIVPAVCCVIATFSAVVATMYLGSIVKLLTRFVYMCAYFDRSTCWI